MILLEQVADALRPWVGEPLLAACPQLCTEIQRRLQLYVMGRDDPEGLRSGLEGLIRATVRKVTEETWLVRLPDGSLVRMESEDFPIIADELMYILFDQYPIDARHLMWLRDFSLRASSLSAIRILYTKYADYASADELNALARVARSCPPAFRGRAWLKEEEPAEPEEAK